MASCAWRLVPTKRMRPPSATVSLIACKARCNIGTDSVRSTMWMLLRVPKMYSDIFGFQRWAWWPKCTPASNSWRMLKSGSAIGCSPVDPPRTASPAFWTGHRTAKSQGPRVKLGRAYIGSAARAQQSLARESRPQQRLPLQTVPLQRLHGDNAGNGLDRAGNLWRDLEAAGQLDLDLAAVSQQKHHADFAVGGLGGVAVPALLRSFEPARHAHERLRITQENAQAAMHPGCRLIERLDRLNAGADLVALHFGGEKQQHRTARFQEIAVLGKPLGK